MISKNVKIFTFISLLFITLLVIGGVSAAVADENQDTTTDTSMITTDSDVIEQANEINVQKQITNIDVKESEQVSTYADLKTSVNEATDEETEIDLQETTYSIDESIEWGTSETAKTLTINGNGAIIDGSNNYQFLTVKEGFTVNLNNLIIQNTKAEKGSAIINYGTLNVNNVTFKDNVAEKNANLAAGAAIYSEGTTTIKDSTFTNNRITGGVNGDEGAAVFAKGALYVYDSKFDSNIGEYTDTSSSSNGANGGAIAVIGSVSDFIVDNTTFTNNKGRHGGALLIYDSQGRNQGTKKITASTFTGNQAIYGGAIEVYNDLIIEDSVFEDNKVYGVGSGGISPKGGAIIVNNLTNTGECSLTVRNTSFERNTAPQTTVSGTTIRGEGGAIYNSGLTTTIDNCTFTENSAYQGGAFYCKDTDRNTARHATMTNSIFKENVAYTGAAIYDAYSKSTTDPDTLTIDQCLFEDNAPTNSGYGIVADYDDLTITNTEINGNNPINQHMSSSTKYANNVTINGLHNITSIYINVPVVSPTNYEELLLVSKEINNEYTGTGTVRVSLDGTEYIETEPIIFDNTTCTVAFFGNAKTINANGMQFLTIGEGKKVVINNMTIANAKADNGAAIINYGTLTTQSNTKFENNEALYYGGAIYSTGELSVSTTNFTNNKVSTISTATRNDYGGAAICSLGKLTVQKSNFVENVAAHNDVATGGDGGCGGAINILNTSQAVSITTSNFTKNSARHGGAILINNNDKTNTNKVTIDKNNFDENTALYGGAIDTYQQVNITNNNFTKNSVSGQGSGGRTSMGGAIVINGGNSPYTAIVQNNSFKENEAKDDGCAGVILTQPDTTLVSSNNIYQDNKAFDTGVVNNLGTATFTNDTFTGNSATYTGVFTQQGDELTITDCTFENNDGNGYGDLIYGFTDATITNSIINTDDDEKLVVMRNSVITATDNTVNGVEFESELIKTTLTFDDEVVAYLNTPTNITVNVLNGEKLVNEGTVTLTDVDSGNVLGESNVEEGKAIIEVNVDSFAPTNIKAVYTTTNGVHTDVEAETTIKTLSNSTITTDKEEYQFNSKDEEDTILVTVTDDSGDYGWVHVYIGDSDTFTFGTQVSSDGTASLTPGFHINGLTESTPITIRYDSNSESVQPCNITVNLVYTKQDTSITYDVLNDIEGKVAIDFTILDEENNEIYNGQLTLTGDITGTINSDKVYKNTELTEGEYTFDVKFEETSDYKESNITITLPVQKDPQKIIDELNESLINNQTALENNITALEQLQAENDALQEQIENLEEALQANKTALANNITALDEANEQITQLEQNIETLEDALEANKTALREAETALADAQGEIESLNGEISNLESALESNKTALADANDQIEDLNTQISNLESALESNKTALADANTQIGDLNSQISDLQSALAANETALADANAQIEDLNTKISELETALEGNKTALAGAEADNAELAAQIENLEAALESNKTALADAQGEIESLNGEISNLESALESNKTALADANDQIEDLNTQISNLESALESNKTALADANVQIEDLNTQISNLESALAANETALREAETALAEAESEIESLNGQISDLEDALADAESELADTQEALEEANNEIDELKYKVSELELALNMTEQALDKVIEALQEQNKAKTTSISIDTINDAKYGDEITISGLLVNEDAIGLSNEVVTITFNDEEIEVTTRNGEFSYTTTATVIGENTITASYAGSDKYVESDADYTFEVAKADTTVTITDIEAVKKGETVTITGTLTDHNGNVLANKVVRLLINNGRKTLKTDADGVYTYDYALNRIGENTITATFEGDDYYTETTETITVEVLPLSSVITIDTSSTVVKGTKATFTGTLTDENGDAIANAQVKLNINGNTKTLKTDSEGKFTHTYTMKTLGENTVTAAYAGSANYVESDTTTTVEVVKAEAVITLDSIESVTKGDAATFSGKLTDAEGNAIANAQVRITINGSPKTLRTDENGVFTHTFKMIKEGTNNITAVFNGNNDYQAANTNSTVEVIKAE